MTSLLILSFSPIDSDARVLKQIELFRHDYEVTTCGYGPAPEGVARHVEIPSDLPVWRYPRLLVIARQYRRAYRGNAAIQAARAALAGSEFDIVLANDVDAVPLALALRPPRGVHADLHEYAPRQNDELLRFRLFVRPFIEWMCRRFVRRADSWTTVSDGIAREYGRRFGFTPAVVTNAAPYVDAEPTPVHEPLRFVHSGAALRGRGIDTLVEGIMAARSGTLDLYLTPNDPGYLDAVKALAHASAGRVRVHDPVPYAQLAKTLRSHDVGVFLLPPVNFNHRWALPNKFFDFVQARLGLVIGPSPEMTAYIERFGIGVVTRDFSAAALAEAVDALDAEAVAGFKLASHTHARELSSSTQIEVWRRAIAALAG